MARFFTVKLTKEQLAEKLCYAFVKNYLSNDEVLDDFNEAESVFDKAKICVTQLGVIASKADKDIQKVKFDWENWTADENEGYNGADTLIGFNTLPNGLTYLGVIAGGDWEIPVFFILYFDGNCIRGYIPEDGNHWNRKTKQAYGNSDEEDLVDIKKQYDLDEGSMDDVPKLDPDKVIADIQSRIVFKE